MDNASDEKLHDQFAYNYDHFVREYNSYTNEVIFGMCYNLVKPSDSLLDLGIGTGLSSYLFAKAGLIITGLDESQKMLDECKKKRFAKTLLQYDLTKLPLPFPKDTFSHIICCGVLHFIGNLLPIFKEAKRIQETGGIFTFSTITLETDNTVDNYIEFPTQWNQSCYKHSPKYIKNISEDLGYSILKVQKLLTNSDDNNQEYVQFDVFVIQKQ
ncbi:MAG: methyltransferase domain-containing protein [Clostridiales bacterium]|nr:methyltransferase domain-containing protein [Clostridiales bacterium]